MTRRKTMPKANSGSPKPGEPEYLLVGKLRRPHGLRGDLVMEIITDFPERLIAGTQVFIGEQRLGHEIVATRHHAHGLLIRFRGIDTPETGGLLRNERVYVRVSDRPPLPEGQFYQHELLGLEVIDEHGTVLGALSEILATGANDVYVVKAPQGGELLLPAIESVVVKIDVPERRIHVRVPDGLMPKAPRSKVKAPPTRENSNAGRE